MSYAPVYHSLIVTIVGISNDQPDGESMQSHQFGIQENILCTTEGRATKYGIVLPWSKTVIKLFYSD